MTAGLDRCWSPSRQKIDNLRRVTALSWLPFQRCNVVRGGRGKTNENRQKKMEERRWDREDRDREEKRKG
ncbi:hypothetical protein PoB_001820600 [Plakobranchus ocellatus]|uniref:Uncharacterized protein n=1 Tax=Plakobranchus ocellatus TaxID=259542 RepID=A0AAV3YX67_9GAST|nr:hypothetical protein PoB_001820600 [Plakobranchus ocellatus]